MEYVRRRDRIIIKLPKVTDFYLATLIREEDGIFYVKLDRGDYFSFKNKDLIVERGIDRICPELITIDRIYDYVRGIGDAVTHINKPDTEALIPKVEEVVTPEAEIREEAIVDEKEEVEEDKSEDADSLEEDVPEDLEAYDEESEESPKDLETHNEENEEPETSEEVEDTKEDMFDVPVEKLDDSVTLEDDDSKEVEEISELPDVDDSVEVEEPVEEIAEDEPVDDSIVVEESDKSEELENEVEPTEDFEEEVEEATEEVDENTEVEDEPEEEVDEFEELEEEDEVAIESNIEETDIMVEDSANDDEGDIHEALFSNMPYYMRSLLLLEAARSFSKNDRLVIRVRAENKYYLATVTMNRKGMLHILFDHGEKHSLKPSSSLIMGIGQQKKYPYAITLNQLHRFLLVPYNTKIVKVKKVLSPSEMHEKAKQYIPEETKVVKERVKKDNTGPYPIKPFKVLYKKKSVKPPKQENGTGYLSKMTPSEIDEMLS
jgi:chemotaxis protein histidine kinase CheA